MWKTPWVRLMSLRDCSAGPGLGIIRSADRLKRTTRPPGEENTVAAKPAALTHQSAAWNEFRNLVSLRISDCNLIAEQPLWTVIGTTETPGAMVAVSTTMSEDRVECSFDFETGTLFCKTGPAIHAESIAFE